MDFCPPKMYAIFYCPLLNQLLPNWDNEVNDSHVVNIKCKVHYSFIFDISSVRSSISCVAMHSIKFYFLRNKSTSLLDFLRGQTSLSRSPSDMDVR